MIVNPDFVEGLDETDGAEQVTKSADFPPK
jgi:hypothetical protein